MSAEVHKRPYTLLSAYAFMAIGAMALVVRLTIPCRKATRLNLEHSFTVLQYECVTQALRLDNRTFLTVLARHGGTRHAAR